MRITLIGPPGSGKGTYAQMLESKFKRISMGDLLRKFPKNTRLGKEISSNLEKGKLVSDAIIIKIIKHLIKKEKNKKNMIFDGFPRTINQLKALDKILKMDKVILLKISDKIIINRLSGRLQCIKCGRVYHVKNDPPRKKDICDFCSGVLYKRSDEDAIKTRLKIYKKNIKPVLDFYKKKKILFEINAEGTIKSVFKRLEKLLKE